MGLAHVGFYKISKERNQLWASKNLRTTLAITGP